MKKRFYALLLFIIPTVLCIGQNNITGIILTTDNAPVEFANIVMQTRADSAFITGTITDLEGNFTLPLGNHSPQNIQISISCLGYESRIIQIDKTNLETIILNDATQKLDEVVISARRSPYTMKGGSLQANISASPLKDAGSATDVLKSLPLVNISEDKINVFGKGTPLIFINNREVRNNEELTQLNSSQIKNVEIITSPGAKYPATVSAVIRITTIRKEDDGLSGSVYGRVDKRENWNETVSANLNYTANKVDIFAAFALYNSKRQTDQTDATTISDSEIHTVKETVSILSERTTYRPSLGIDYNINDNHSLGAKYDLSVAGKAPANIYTDLMYYINENPQSKLTNDGRYNSDNNNGYLNTYYSGRMGDFQLNLNADYAHGNSTSNDLFTTITEDETNIMRSNTENKYKLAAVKADANYQVGKGSIEMGVEYSYTNNKSSYKNDNEDLQEDLPSRRTENKQNLMGLFAAYRHTWDKFNLYAGLRYEHIDFQYHIDKVKSNDQSKSYNNLFPILNLSYSLMDDKINMSLSYRRTTSRPSYYQLRGDIQYNSPFSYEGGNPALKNTFINDLTYTISWADLFLSASYKTYKDISLFTIGQFEDKPISLSTSINVDDFKTFSLSAIWNPTFFKIWNPQLEAGFEKQFLEMEYNNEIRRYNKPSVMFGINNTLKLPANFTFIIQGQYWNKHNGGFSLSKEVMYVDARIQKRFLDNALTATLGMENIFDTKDEKWTMNYKNVIFDKSAKIDNRFVYLSLRYTFNKMKTYKGKGAANAERRRL